MDIDNIIRNTYLNFKLAIKDEDITYDRIHAIVMKRIKTHTKFDILLECSFMIADEIMSIMKPDFDTNICLIIYSLFSTMMDELVSIYNLNTSNKRQTLSDEIIIELVNKHLKEYDIDIRNRAINIIKQIYRLSPNIPPFTVLNLVDKTLNDLTLPGINSPDISDFGRLHMELVSNIYCNIDEYHYLPLKTIPIENFQFMSFADGRSYGEDGRKNSYFFNEMTDTNTFYLDINPSVTPDSISDLTIDDANIIYNSKILPCSTFQVISALNANYNGKSLFLKDNAINIVLYKNLHKYLAPNGVLQILNACCSNDKIISDELNQIFHIETIAHGHFLLFKR